MCVPFQCWEGLGGVGRRWGGCGEGGPLPREHQLGLRVRGVVWRRPCSCTRTLSTSQWRRGTLARSPAWRYAAALGGSRWGWGSWPGGGPFPLYQPLGVRVRWRRVCSKSGSGAALSISPWLRGTLARSPACRLCSAPRTRSTSPWLRGTLARSPACRCAALPASGATEGWGGVSFGHQRAHSACGGAAQNMFSGIVA